MIAALQRREPQLFLTSAIVLYLELLLIRWVPANVTYVLFFSNLVVMASFLGIGLGVLAGLRTGVSRFAPYGPALVATVLLISAARIDVRPAIDGSFLGELVREHRADPNLLVLPLIFALVALVLGAVALPLGPLFRGLPPLRAYAIDIAGSIVGIGAFTALSALGTPPPVWFGVLGVALALRGAGRVGVATLVGTASFAAVLAITVLAQQVSGDVWSPYYRITMRFPQGAFPVLAVNGIPHQNFYPLDFPRREAFYDQVYRWFPGRRFDRVLIIGAGNGTDVDGALAHGAISVDAVEIDPRILELGERYHPDHPYADPRVHQIVDDGRAVLRRSGGTYDLIVLALTDSLTLSSSAANLRLESFLYTEEALDSARDHLAPAGVLAIYNYYDQPFLIEKLGRMLEESFGVAPIIRSYGVATASGVGAAFAVGESMGQPADRVDEVSLADAPPPATDDWPFLYLQSRTIPGFNLLALAGILVMSGGAVWVTARAAGTSAGRASPHFFVLGAAFLLVETKNLATFSLLFGSTWVVNALVFAAILLSVLAAIAVTSCTKIPRPLPYLLLAATLAVTFIIPPQTLLLDPLWLRYSVASVLAFLPVFFANLIFTSSFRDTRTADMAFASNVFGAVVGGCLEYLALVTGYRALVLVIAALYALAYLFTRIRVLGDRDLVSGG